MKDRTDTERLDWLERQCTIFVRAFGQPRCCELCYRPENELHSEMKIEPTLRKAIDAAMEEAK